MCANIGVVITRQSCHICIIPLLAKKTVLQRMVLIEKEKKVGVQEAIAATRCGAIEMVVVIGSRNAKLWTMDRAHGSKILSLYVQASSKLFSRYSS